MIQIRRNLFETNSSSTHVLTMCTESDWLKWEKGIVVFDNWTEKFVSRKLVEEKKKQEENDRRFSFSPDEYFETPKEDGYETFKYTYKGIIAFGYYGD